MQIATITTLATLAAAALQPPPPRFSPPANLFLPASPAVNAWMDANIKPGSDWRPVARTAKGMTLVRWPDQRVGTNCTLDLRGERLSGQPPADGAQSWTTTYRLDCHANLNGPVGYVTTGLHFAAQAAAGFSGQNLTGEARPIGLGVTLEYPQAPCFPRCVTTMKLGAGREPPGPADLTNPAAVQAWGQATLDLKGWSLRAGAGRLFVPVGQARRQGWAADRRGAGWNISIRGS